LSTLEHTGEHHHDNSAASGYGDNEVLYVHEFRDDYGSKLGMWLFLFTEVLLFGGLFFAYFWFRVKYPEGYHDAAQRLDIMPGAINTIILLTSSLTMAYAIVAIQKGKKALSNWYLGGTLAFGFWFLINKYFEWSHKIHLDIYPGSDTVLNKFPDGEGVFFTLYYLMTGLHTLHVIIGMVVIGFIMVSVSTENINKNKYIKMENAGLYWHLVDLIWIFLFPLFYLLH